MRQEVAHAVLGELLDVVAGCLAAQDDALGSSSIARLRTRRPVRTWTYRSSSNCRGEGCVGPMLCSVKDVLRPCAMFRPGNSGGA